MATYAVLPNDAIITIATNFNHPGDVVRLSRVNKQSNQALNDNWKNTFLTTLFFKLGWRCSGWGRISSFLNLNKRLVVKFFQPRVGNALAFDTSDLDDLAKSQQYSFIRQVFEAALLWNKDRAYQHFSAFINDANRKMDTIRDQVYYAVMTSDRFEGNRLHVKGNMKIADRALLMASEECNIPYLKKQLAAGQEIFADKAFKKAFELYLLSNEEKYQDFWLELLEVMEITEYHKCDALTQGARHGYMEALEIIPYLEDSNSLRKAIAEAVKHGRDEFFMGIIGDKLFKENWKNLLDLEWVVKAIHLVDDETLADWMGVEITGRANFTNPLPYLLIHHNKPKALKKLGSSEFLKPDRCLENDYWREKSGYFTRPPFRWGRDTKTDYPTTYLIPKAQDETIPGKRIVEMVFCEENNNLERKLLFLAANGYVDAVKRLLNQATQEQKGLALTSAATYRCEKVVKLIVSEKPQDILEDDYKKCLRIAAIGGFDEIFKLLLAASRLDPAQFLEDGIVFHQVDIVNTILEMNPKTNEKILESCLLSLCRLEMGFNYLNVLNLLIKFNKINKCSSKTLIKSCAYILMPIHFYIEYGGKYNKNGISKEKISSYEHSFMTMLSHLAPKHFNERITAQELEVKGEVEQNGLSWLMEEALQSQNETIIIAVQNLRNLAQSQQKTHPQDLEK